MHTYQLRSRWPRPKYVSLGGSRHLGAQAPALRPPPANPTRHACRQLGTTAQPEATFGLLHVLGKRYSLASCSVLTDNCENCDRPFPSHTQS
jgi:hypothetical protein